MGSLYVGTELERVNPSVFEQQLSWEKDIYSGVRDLERARLSQESLREAT